MKRALITGISGQDGVYLSEMLLGKGYEVVGISRNSIRAATRGLTIIETDITDFDRLRGIVREVRPDEVYNLASQSHVSVSFEQPILTVKTVALGARMFSNRSDSNVTNPECSRLLRPRCMGTALTKMDFNARPRR